MFHLNFCPYLSLDRPLVVGDWQLGPASNFAGRWIDPDFERLAKQFLSRFTDFQLRALPEPSLLVHREGGLDGRLPSDTERRALQCAIEFAVIDANPRFTRESRGMVWRVATSDNAALFFWPIDTETGYVTIQRGSVMLSTLDGGWKIDDEDLRIPAPPEVETGNRVMPDPDLLSEVYRLALRGLTDDGQLEARRMTTAIHWLAKAWRNSPSIDPEDRLVMLKTGFEALTGESDSRLCARRLRELFRSVLPADPAAVDSDFLWSPSESDTELRSWVTRAGEPREEHVTPLEHWFLSFADARNAVVHGGADRAGSYGRAGSRYEGSFIFTAEWILRLAVKLQAHLLGATDLWCSPGYRAALAAFREYHTDESSSDHGDQ